MENPTNKTPHGVQENSGYGAEKPAMVIGSPSFIADAAVALIQTNNEISNLKHELVKISYNVWFKNAARLDVETDEDGRILVFETANPTKDNFVGTYQFAKLQSDFYSVHKTLISTILAELTSKIENRSKELATPILNERIQQCENLCKALIRNTTVDEILTSPKLTASFKEMKRKGNWYDGIGDVSSIPERRFIIVDNIHAIPETNNYDQFIGQGKTNLIQNSFKMFKECFRNPTQSLVKNCTEAVIQIEGNTDDHGSESGKPSMYA